MSVSSKFCKLASMDILEKIAVRNVTQNVEAVIFTVAYAILDVNQDGKERTVLKVLFFCKKKKIKKRKTKTHILCC